MTLKPLLSLLLILGLAGCAHLSPTVDVPVVAQKPAAVEARPAPPPVMPAQELTEQVLYQFLLAETAWQRGEGKLAAEAYVDLALRTGDARIAKRATELALLAQLRVPAAKAAKLWVELEPGSDRARQVYITLLAADGHIKETRPHFEALLSAAVSPAGRTVIPVLPSPRAR